MTKKEISILSGLIFTILLSLLSSQIHTAENITQNTLRLHIIANSNSAYDQWLKQDIRDEILYMTGFINKGVDNFDEALESTRAALPDMEKELNRVLYSKNIGYTAKCSLEKFNFNTTQYDDFALPKGEYTALTVRLGEAKGDNWWCVIYPSLCGEAFGENALDVGDGFIKTDKITPRFKVVEIYRDIKTKLFGQNSEIYTHCK